MGLLGPFSSFSFMFAFWNGGWSAQMAGVPVATLNCEDKDNVLGMMKQSSEQSLAPCGLHKATKLNLTQL